jgi:hypothetical protein
MSRARAAELKQLLDEMPEEIRELP